ncbi:MAG: hypothetical protein CMH83_10665 [Nocardioides sp.]|nr:hypothetical protein [Nocardioides sp.]
MTRTIRPALAAIVLAVCAALTITTVPPGVAAVPTATPAPVDAAPVAARGKPKVAIKLGVYRAPATIVTGSRLRFLGRTQKALRGKKVSLQRKVGKKGSWVTVGAAKVNSKQRFLVSGVVTGVGAVYWKVTAKKKVRKNGRKVTLRYTSKQVGTAVYGWFYAADQQPVAVSWSDWDDLPRTIGGVRYSKSVGTDAYYFSDGDVEWGDYNLSYRCKTFTAQVGLDDESETGAKADFYVTLDDARTRVASGKGLGAATSVTMDVASRLRIRLEVEAVTQYDAVATFGDAKFLCRGKP